MLVIKFVSKEIKENNILEKTIAKLANLLRKNEYSELSLIRDKESVEIVSGNLQANRGRDEEVTVELTIKKSITIDKNNLADKQELDKLVREIVHFCEQSAEINELKYLPINYR